MLIDDADVILAFTLSNVHGVLHVVFILLIIFTTMFFCHSLIRLCMLSQHPKSRRLHNGIRRPLACHAEGEFSPSTLIRVHISQDEELALDGALRDGGTPVKPPPPAYGVWRHSVVRAEPRLLSSRVVQVTNGQHSSASIPICCIGRNRPSPVQPLTAVHIIR